MSFINLFSKRCFSDKSYKIHAYIEKHSYKDFINNGEFSYKIEYDNGFYLNYSTLSKNITLPSGIVLNLSANTIETLNSAVEEMLNEQSNPDSTPESNKAVFNKYMKVTPDTEYDKAFSQFCLFCGNYGILSVIYSIVNNNGGKSFDIKIINTNNNFSYSCVIKTSADKDNKTSSGSIDGINDVVSKLLETKDYNTPITLKISIKEI